MTKKNTKQANRKFEAYSVFVASAGMCDAGPMIEYLERFDDDPANTIILTGYQSAGTTGRKLMNRATIECPPPKDILLGKAEVVDMSGFYSAHADQDMILNNLFDLSGKKSHTSAKVLINHGDAASKDALEEVIRKRAEIMVPGERTVRDVCIADSRWINLDSDEYLTEAPTNDVSCAGEIKTDMAEMKSEIKELGKMLRQLLERVAA